MLAPSILSADFTNIRSEFEIMNKEKVDFIHIDVMDGNYVPNISFGTGIIKQLRTLTDIPFDTHLMIKNPENYVLDFKRAGCDILTIHPITTKHLDRTINLIKENDMKVGIALNPSDNLEILDYVLEDIDLVLIMSVNPGFGGQSFIKSSLRKIRKLKDKIKSRNLNTLIEVDGGVKLTNVSDIRDAGADIVVVGSAIFGADNPREEIKKFMEY